MRFITVVSSSLLWVVLWCLLSSVIHEEGHIFIYVLFGIPFAGPFYLGACSFRVFYVASPESLGVIISNFFGGLFSASVASYVISQIRLRKGYFVLELPFKVILAYWAGLQAAIGIYEGTFNLLYNENPRLSSFLGLTDLVGIVGGSTALLVYVIYLMRKGRIREWRQFLKALVKQGNSPILATSHDD